MKHLHYCTAFTLTLLLVATSCKQALPPQTEFKMGTVCSINLFEKGTPQLYSEIFQRLTDLESILSANRNDTNIAEINAKAGIAPFKAAPETLYVLQTALLYSEKTQGAFDPTIGPLVKAWNIGTEYAAVPSPEVIKKVRSLIDYRKIVIDPVKGTVFLPLPGMKLDLGAIAKGYAADEIVTILTKHKIKKAIIDLGGNIFAYGEKTPNKNWIIGIRNPENPDENSILTIPVTNKTIVTSGVYERFFEQDGIRYHHILDPATGFPVNNDLLSVTIITSISINADALSTSAFLLGTDRGMALINSLPDTEAIFINKKHEIRVTPGLKNNISLKNTDYTVIQ